MDQDSPACRRLYARNWAWSIGTWLVILLNSYMTDIAMAIQRLALVGALVKDLRVGFLKAEMALGALMDSCLRFDSSLTPHFSLRCYLAVALPTLLNK